MIKKRKRPTKKTPVCKQCGAPMNTPVDQRILAHGGLLCWVCKTQILMRRDEVLREHGLK